MSKTALIIGAGSGISGAFAIELADEGYSVCLACRNTDKLKDLSAKISASTFKTDCSKEESILHLFDYFDVNFGIPDLVLYNCGSRVRGKVHEIDRGQASESFKVNINGAFTVAQEASKRMIAAKRGAIFFTGATASIKGFPGSSIFAMGKFAIRGLAQSLYRELSPLGIHVAHFVIDGAVEKGVRLYDSEKLTSEAIAKSYMSVLRQPRQAWTHEIELRTFVEKF